MAAGSNPAQPTRLRLRQMYLLTINPGSTSAKYALFKNEISITKGEFRKKENTYSFEEKQITKKDYSHSFEYFTNYCIAKGHIKFISDIKKIGIRIVHGGTEFSKPTLINNKSLTKLKEISVLAPLHNPPAINLIEQIHNTNSNIPIIGVFDTAFHTTIPDFASQYAIPTQLSKKNHIQKYGFHGIACQSVLNQLKEISNPLSSRIIICHLGGGASITAVKNGHSIDTTMGFTPLAGLMMISRSGNISPGIIPYLEDQTHLTEHQILEILNKQSGIKGMTGTDDMKQVVENAQDGDPVCKLVVEMFVYRIVKYIFSYYGVLQGLDVLTFSGGIGKGNAFLRQIICEELRMIGVRIEDKLNNKINQFPRIITSPGAEKQVVVMKVDENVEIAKIIN